MTDLEIYHNAPEEPTPEELAAYLDQACADDVELRAKVEALYAVERDQNDDFLSRVAVPGVGDTSFKTPLR